MRIPGSNIAEIREAVRQLSTGRGNSTGSVTLQPSSMSTVVADPRLSIDSVISLMPVTASAATAATSIYITGQDKGTMTINHTLSAATDQTFKYSIRG